MPEDNNRYGLVTAFHFSVTFEGNKGTNWTIGFSEVSGIGMELQTEDISEGGMNGFVLRLPKPPKFRNLVLKRALSKAGSDIVEWATAAINDFTFSTKTVQVSLMDENNNPVKSWRFYQAYPVKIGYSDLGATKNEVVIETLELAYMSQTVVKDKKDGA